jgi:prepilin-type N-terminal cleavage/methylation domain-containing protein
MKKYNSKGFTLVELLLVIAIIAILATVLFVSLGGQRERARVTSFKENMRGLITAYTACRDGNGTAVGGAADGTVTLCNPAGTSGITSTIPKTPNCNGSGNVTITMTNGTADNWSFSSTCTRSAGTCVMTCNTDGCTNPSSGAGSLCE